MNIILNGNCITIKKGLSLNKLLLNYDYQNKLIAVEINNEIIVKSQHNNYIIQAADKIEIINAVGGG